MSRSVQEEVDLNYAAFEKLLPGLITSKRGQYALMKDQQVTAFFSTALDARTAGDHIVGDKIYSLQVVDDAAINLGFYTDAIVID